MQFLSRASLRASRFYRHSLRPIHLAHRTTKPPRPTWLRALSSLPEPPTTAIGGPDAHPVLELPNNSSLQDPSIPAHAPVTIVQDKQTAMKCLDEIRLRCQMNPSIVFACDTETIGVDPRKESPCGKGIAICASIYGGPDFTFGCLFVDNLGPAEGTLDIFKEFFESEDYKKVWHNYSFDYHILGNHGIHCGGFHGDTMHMARLDIAGYTRSYSLEKLTKLYAITSSKRSMVDMFTRPIVKKDGTEGKTMVMPPLDELQLSTDTRNDWVAYSCNDSIATLNLFEAIRTRLQGRIFAKDNELKEPLSSAWSVYERFLRPFGKVLVDMEARGFQIRQDGHVERMLKLAKEDSARQRTTFLDWASKYSSEAKYMNPGSHKQLQALFFAPFSTKGGMVGPAYVFKALNTDNVIVGNRKTPTKFIERTIVGLGVPTDGFRNNKGSPSVDAAHMQQLIGQPHADPPVFGGIARSPKLKTKAEKLEACLALDALLSGKQIDKLVSTYLLPLMERQDENGRIHGSLNINTDTGRLSSRAPNLQNQPAMEKDKYGIRDSFSTKQGNKLIVADYGQLELRLLAHMSRCKSMIDAFKAGGDFHSRTAIDMYPYMREAVANGEVLLEWDSSKGEPPKPLVKDAFSSERRKAKVLNFSIAYGKTAYGLSKDWDVELDEAQHTIDLWYKSRPEVLEWQHAARKFCCENMFVKTILGRRRYLEDITSEDDALRSGAERAAINSPIQGSAADVVMAAMLNIAKDEEMKSLGYEMLLQVHDEIIMEGPEGNAEAALARLKKLMSTPFKQNLLVDLEVDGAIGNTWAEAK